MVRVNLHSKVWSAKAQIEMVAATSEKAHCKSLSDYVWGSKYGDLRNSLIVLESEIDQLEGSDPNIVKIKALWSEFQEAISSSSVEGEVSVKVASEACSLKLEEISEKLDQLEKRYQEIPVDSPFAHDEHYPLNLCLLSDSVPVKKFSQTYYLVDDKGVFKAFVSDTAMSKMEGYSPNLRVAEGYFEVDAEGNPVAKLAKNEVTEERLLEMEELYNKISENKTVISIIGSEHFKSKVCSSIKIAISRDSGFDLFTELTDPGVVGACPIVYVEKDVDPMMKWHLAGADGFPMVDLSGVERQEDGKFVHVNAVTGDIEELKAVITIQMKDADIAFTATEDRSTGARQSRDFEYFIIMLHETCHAQHFLTDVKAYHQNRRQVSKDSKDTNREEQLTIYGKCEGPSGTFVDGQSCKYSENLFRLEHGLDVRRYHLVGTRKDASYYQQLRGCVLRDEVNGFAAYLIDLYAKQPDLFKDISQISCQTLLKYTLENYDSSGMQELALYLSIDTIELPASLIRRLSKDQVEKLAIIKSSIASKYPSKSAAFFDMLIQPRFTRSEQISFLKITGSDGDFFKDDEAGEVRIWGLVLSLPILMRKVLCDLLIEKKNFSQQALKVIINGKFDQIALQILKIQPSLLYQTTFRTPCNLVESLIIGFKGTPDERFLFVQYIVVSFREYIDFDKKGDSGLSLKEELKLKEEDNYKYKNILNFIYLYEISEGAPSRAANKVELNAGQIRFYNKIIQQVAKGIEGPELLSMPKASDSQWKDLSNLISDGADVSVFAQYLLNEYISPYCSPDEVDDLLKLAMRSPKCDPNVFLLLAFYFDTSLPLHEEICKNDQAMRNVLLRLRKVNILTCNLKVPIKTRVIQYRKLTNISRLPLIELLEEAFPS